MITAVQLAAKGNEMRMVQSEYFRTKSFIVLDKARKLEREFDAMVTQVLNAQVPQTGNLFEKVS